MSTLAPDEKTCPFCAETIKKGAVKCRYCQSDLAGTGIEDAEPAPEPRPEPGPVPDTRLDPSPPEPDRISLDKGQAVLVRPTAAAEPEDPIGAQPLLASLRLMIVLLVACLVLAAVTAFAYWRSQHPGDEEKAGVITSAGAREAGLSAASTLTQKAFSYEWTTFDKDAAASEATMAPSLRKEYSATLAKARANAIKSQVKQKAVVSAASVVSASPTRVEALVFMNILTTGKANRQNVTTSRLVVTLVRHGEEWRMSAIKPI